MYVKNVIYFPVFLSGAVNKDGDSQITVINNTGVILFPNLPTYTE